MTKRFVSWSAVSSEPQAKKISLTDQTATNAKHVKQHGGTLIAELTVPGESRNIILFEDACRRIEAYAQLRDLIADKAFDVLICLNRGRLGRTMSLVESISALCIQAGALIYETENPPPNLEVVSSFDNLLSGAIKSASAQNEIQQLIKRNAMGMLARVKSGKFYNNVPYGWRKVYNGNEEHYEIDEQAAEAVRLIVALYLEQGRGTKAIAEELTSKGYESPSGKEWSRQTIQYMLQRAWVYAGYTEINRNSQKGRPYARFPGDFPAIITEAEAEEIVQERRSRVDSRRAVQSHRLSRVVWCDICDTRVVGCLTSSGRTLKDGTKKRYYAVAYRCPTPHKHPIKNIREHKLLKIVERAIRDFSDPATQARILTERPDHSATIESEIAQHEARLQKVNEQVERADDAFVTGVMDRERYQRQMTRLAKQAEGIQASITQCHDQLRQENHSSQLATRLNAIATHGLQMLHHQDIPTANAWLRKHLRIHITESGISITPT